MVTEPMIKYLINSRENALTLNQLKIVGCVYLTLLIAIYRRVTWEIWTKYLKW